MMLLGYSILALLFIVACACLGAGLLVCTGWIVDRYHARKSSMRKRRTVLEIKL